MPLCVFSPPHLKHDCGLRYGAYKPRPPDLKPPGTPPLQCVTIFLAVHLISYFYTIQIQNYIVFCNLRALATPVALNLSFAKHYQQQPSVCFCFRLCVKVVVGLLWAFSLNLTTIVGKARGKNENNENVISATCLVLYDDNNDSDLMAVCWPVHFKKASHLLLMVAFTQKLCWTEHSELLPLLTYIALAGVHSSPPLPSGSNYPDISFARARRLTSTFRPSRFCQAAFHFRYLTITHYYNHSNGLPSGFPQTWLNWYLKFGN